MKKIEHAVTHYYQPTSNSCGYAALSILLSHYGAHVKPEELLKKVPQPKYISGKPTGSITAQLASWCSSEGFKVDFYSFDFEILDLTWAKLSDSELIQKLELVKEIRNVPGLSGNHWSKIYVQAYIDLISADAKLSIKPHVTSKLLYSLLQSGPVYTNICVNTVNNEGRAIYPDMSKRELVFDDLKGSVNTHSFVIYGVNTLGDFLVADPWHGRRVIKLETMLCGISAAQIECDNQCFQIKT